MGRSWLALLLAVVAHAQVCRLSVAGLNRERRVIGPVNTECPTQPIHSAPFGNWGVTSNYGGKRDGHQFDGWCHNSMVCDNSGNCRTDCRDGWYEWNSCTSHPSFKAPNCTLYNDTGCTEQKSTQGINVLGTQSIDVRVGCPVDTNNDGTPDEGGCADVRTYTHTQNFMSLYELDPLTGDELVQTLYFPSTPVPAQCLALGCSATGSDWVNPIAYDSPKDRAVVYAQMATVINSGAFVDAANVCRGVNLSVRGVSSASFFGPAVAASSLVTLFGRDLIATPQDVVTIRITDRNGATRDATPIFANAGQVNFVMPDLLLTGQATVAVLAAGRIRATGVLEIEPVAPALFAANGNGAGPAAAYFLRPGDFSYAFTCTPGQLCLDNPVDVSDGATYLVLYGTGIRGRSTPAAVQVIIGGLAARVEYAGPQGQLPGLDQINVRLPRELAGRGPVPVVLTIEGRQANVVTIATR
ncbi:MAG: hypothetical protein IT168_30630 [Bryobacterales bacterium]|nr:hypothetical protein [Bryobacterales bacterium]